MHIYVSDKGMWQFRAKGLIIYDKTLSPKPNISSSYLYTTNLIWYLMPHVFLLQTHSNWHHQMSSRCKLHVPIRRNQFGGLITSSTLQPNLLQQTTDREVCRSFHHLHALCYSDTAGFCIWNAPSTHEQRFQHLRETTLYFCSEADACIVDSAVHPRQGLFCTTAAEKGGEARVSYALFLIKTRVVHLNWSVKCPLETLDFVFQHGYQCTRMVRYCLMSMSATIAGLLRCTCWEGNYGRTMDWIV